MAEALKLEVSFVTPLCVIHQGAPPQPGYLATFTWQIDNFKVRGENMSSQMQAGTRATVSVAWKDAAGNVVSAEDTVWSSSDPDIVECTVSTGNPLIANLYAPGPTGKVQIHATADADLGEGIKNVTATTDVEVIEGEAVGGEITFKPTA
jgi:hypothetical protein